MTKLPVSMILCALLSATTTFGQADNNLKQVINDTDPATYRAQNAYTPQPWDLIKEEDIAWKKRVWRTIDLSDKGNAMMAASNTQPSIGEVLLNGLYTAAFKPHLAYADERFTTELTATDIEALRSLRGQEITSLKIKEDWLYLKDTKKIVVRIVGIAPVIASADGSEKKPAFWVFYRDAREYLSLQRIASPGNSPETMDEVFEGRFFASKIDRMSGDPVE